MVRLFNEEVLAICKTVKAEENLDQKVKDIDKRFVLYGPHIAINLVSIVFFVDCCGTDGIVSTCPAFITEKDVQDSQSEEMLKGLVTIKVIDAAEELKEFVENGR